MAETWAEEVQRLQREIADRQARLQHLVLGDPRVSVGVSACGYCGMQSGIGWAGQPPCQAPFSGDPEAHRQSLAEMRRKGCLMQSGASSL